MIRGASYADNKLINSFVFYKTSSHKTTNLHETNAISNAISYINYKNKICMAII